MEETSSNNSKGTRIALFVAILLLLGSATYLFIEKERRSMSEEELKAERLKSESLLAEKLAFEKEMEKYKADLEKMTVASNELHSRAKDTEALLNKAMNDLEKNEKSKQDAEQLKKQLQKLKNEKAELDRQLEEYKNTVSYAQGSEEQNRGTIAALEATNKQLTAQLDALTRTSLDNSLVQTSKKNQKLTVKAKRVKELALEADVFGHTDNVRISLTGPDGNRFTPDLSELTISPTTSNSGKSQAFFSPTGESAVEKNRVEIIYKPKNKLKPGVHKIIVENNGTQIGSLQVKLR